MTLKHAHAILMLTFAVSACAPPREPAPASPHGTPAGAPTAGVPTAGVPTAGAPAAPPVATALPGSPDVPPSPIAVPADALYVCVAGAGGVAQKTIEFAPGVDTLCRKHPEMGPCQYEREACRRGGGRVYAADGKEITAQTEAEYDRKVMRVRLRSN